MIEKFNPKNTWTSFLISKKFLSSLGLESDLLVTTSGLVCAYTGISIIDAKKIKNWNQIKENYHILNDKRIAFNLNTKQDYKLLQGFWNFSQYLRLWTSWFCWNRRIQNRASPFSSIPQEEKSFPGLQFLTCWNSLNARSRRWWRDSRQAWVRC